MYYTGKLLSQDYLTLPTINKIGNYDTSSFSLTSGMSHIHQLHNLTNSKIIVQARIQFAAAKEPLKSHKLLHKQVESGGREVKYIAELNIINSSKRSIFI